MSPVRPIRETIPIEEARELLSESAIPIDRTELTSIRAAMDGELVDVKLF